MAHVTLKHGELYYDVKGSGPPLVMLRGLGRTTRHWLGFDGQMAEHFQVITMDLRGMGETRVPSRVDNSVFDLARDVVALLDHLSIPAAHILGVSLGGMVTLALGLSHPERCLSLIPINTSIAGMGRLRLTMDAARFLTWALRHRDDRIHRRLVDLLVGSACPPERRDEIAAQLVAIAEEDGRLYIGTVVTQLLAAARFRVAKRLGAIAVPTMVLYSTEDRFVPNINSRLVASRIPHATLRPIVGASHEPTLDHGEAVLQLVREWVNELGERRSRQPLPAS